MEDLKGLRYKLRMMGIEFNGPSYMYGDNMSVIHNTQRPQSLLKKTSNSICYHAVTEDLSMGECLTGHVFSEQNTADICTKVMSGWVGRDRITRMVVYDLADDHEE